MKRFLCLLLVPLFLTIAATAEDIPLVKAAELTTRFLAEMKMAEKPMSEFFIVASLVRDSSKGESGPDTVGWRAFLTDSKLDRAGDESKALFKEGGREFRRVLEIRNDGTVVMGKVPAGQPRPRIIPPSKKTAAPE